MTAAATLPQHTIFYKGQQLLVQGRDRMHAKIIVYAAMFPESKWSEIR